MTKVEGIEEHLKEQRLHWLGHVERIGQRERTCKSTAVDSGKVQNKVDLRRDGKSW